MVAGSGGGGIRTVLFDLDGTLIDSEKLILESFRHTMRRHRGEVPPDDAWRATMGTPLAAQLRDFARDEAEAAAMLKTYLEHNDQVHDELVRSFAGVRETLAWLGGSGYRLGLVTSKLREGAIAGLRSCGLPLEWFQGVVTASDPVPHKPDPGPVLLALDRTGEPFPERALFVGDTVWDLRAGRRAGTRTAAALWGPFSRTELEGEEPDYQLERIEDLRTLLDAPPED